MAEPTPRPARSRRLLRVAFVVAGLVAAYGAFGFLAAPSIVARLLAREGSSALRRDVSVARVRVNPFVLSVTIDGLAVRHRDGSPFLAWGSLYVRLAPLRLLAGDVGVAEIRLVRPSVHVGLRPDGTLTFQDLLASREPATAPPSDRRSGLGLFIGKLAVEEAHVAFRDATQRPAFEGALGPLTFRLESFRTKGGRDSPYSFTGTTDSGETFRWTGTVGTEPIRSAGTVAFERIQLPKYAGYLRDRLPIDLQEGLLDLRTRYELDWSATRRALRLHEGEVTVDRLAVGPRGVPDAPVKLPRIEVTGIDLDALARVAKVAEVALRGGTVKVLREADGGFELARMAPPPTPASSPTPAQPWAWSVGVVAVSGLALHVEDRTPPRPASIPLTRVELRVEQLRPGRDAVWPFELSLAWSGDGRASAKGHIQPFARKGTLALEAADLDLGPLEPYLQRGVTARLAGGRASAKARIGFDASGPLPLWTFAGDVRIDGLSVAEAGNEELLRWRALEISGVDAGSRPPRATAKLVRLVEPRMKAYVWEDGTTSFSRARRARVADTAQERKSAPAASAAPAWRTAVQAFQLVGGRAAFVDRTVSPPAVLTLSRAQASVTRLSSDPTVRSTVDVRLDVEGASPVRIAGTLNPLQKDAYTELTVASQGVDLAPLGPYSGKFLGYGIQKGKLDLDLRYRIENRSLVSTNVVRIDRFTLGEKTDSPDATKLPVRLALALLQDKDGIILLDVPVEGNVDDPDFHMGRVIWRAILNVLGKVATSPFRALAALVGGGADADLSLAEFAPGTADPLPAAKERFALLAKSLAQRPALGLELEGSADLDRDGPALRRAALDRSLRRAKAATLKPPAASAEEVTLTPDERARLVRAAYEATLAAATAKGGEAVLPAAGRGGTGAAASPELREMEERLASAVALPPDALRALAAERAQRAREALVVAGLDQTRLFLVEGSERAAKEKGARVYFTVK